APYGQPEFRAVHHGRIYFHAAQPAGDQPVCARSWRHLDVYHDHCSTKHAEKRADLCVDRLPDRLWGQNPNFSIAWLATTGARRSAEPGQYSNVWNSSENGRLWFDPGGSHVAGSDIGIATISGDTGAGGHDLRRIAGLASIRPDSNGCLLLCESHGYCVTGDRHAQ